MKSQARDERRLFSRATKAPFTLTVRALSPRGPQSSSHSHPLLNERLAHSHRGPHYPCPSERWTSLCPPLEPCSPSPFGRTRLEDCSRSRVPSRARGYTRTHRQDNARTRCSSALVRGSQGYSRLKLPTIISAHAFQGISRTILLGYIRAQQQDNVAHSSMVLKDSLIHYHLSASQVSPGPSRLYCHSSSQYTRLMVRSH